MKPAPENAELKEAGMSYLLSFAAWIAYAILGSISSWRTGVEVALIIQAVLVVDLMRKGELDILSVGTLIFFGAMTILALTSPHTSAHKYIPAISAGALAVIAGASLLVDRPFTMEIAKRTTPESLWSHPRFIKTNRFLTAVWAASFACSAIVSALLIALVHSYTVPLVIVQVAGFVVPFRITQSTVAKARARAAEHGIVM
jgi:uncharacterized membrane protein